MKYVLAVFAFLFCGAAQAQDALVVATCGTLPLAYAPGATRLLTVDTTGKLCGTGGGGAGNPGGSNTQVQYNNGGSFGGITGATSNGTTLTLVAPVLGTPASGTLTNTTGFPVANLAGAGTGILASLAANVGSAGAPVLFNGAGGTPSSIALANGTGLPISTGVSGLGTGVQAALAAAMNSSTGPIGALTPTNGNCVTGNGTAWTSATCATGTATAVPSVQSGTNYAFQGTDLTKVIYLSNAANQVPTIAQAGTGSFTSGWYTTACNIGAGTQTITPTTSTIAGASTYVLPAGSVAAPKCIGLISDGTNYVVVPDYFRFGTGTETAAGLALSAAGGLTTTIGSGTATLGTSAITSGSCATVVTVATSNVATTDVISFTPNADITAVTGYAPVTTGGLAIYPYPTSGNANFKVCNPTSSSITPGAVTLNFRVTR